MVDILDAAKEHFNSIETQSIDVPEWKLKIFWRPWNIGEKQKVWGAIKQSGKDAELSARVLIAKALDKDLNPIFSLSNLRELCFNVDVKIVERIALAIIGNEVNQEEITKN